MKKYSKYLISIFCIVAFFVSICFVPINASKLIPLIENQVSKDFGVKIHIERLILRVGPLIKLKTPIMHIMYEDGQKFAQLDNVKFYIHWISLLKETPAINKLQARRLNIRITSEDNQLPILVEKLQNRNFALNPSIQLKNYEINYTNKISSDRYIIEGQNLLLEKVSGFKNMKLSTIGSFSINSKKYINYDLTLNPRIDAPKISFEGDITKFITQIKTLDFHSDIIADLKIYKNDANEIQASGFANIDNISVLDSAKKNPKSFIYLTLLGDKVGVLSNIYTSVNKKVYIEGKINNSKKPVLDFKVKTDEISLADLYQKLRIFADLSRFKGINSLDGKLNANFTIKGDVNNIKSNGFLKITNANIKTNGFKIEKINSDIDFSNNKVNIVNAVGYVNNAPIMAKGSIDKNFDIELLMNKVELQYLCPESLGIKSGIASLVANIKGTFDNLVHKENLVIENLSLIKNDLDLKIDSIKLDTNKNDSAYITGVTCTTKKTETIKIPSLKLIIKDDTIKIPDAKIYMPNSKLALKSEITNYNNNNLSFSTYIDGFINSKDIKQFQGNSTRYPVKIFFNGNKISQNLISQLLVERTDIFDEPVVVNLTSKFEKNTFKIEDLSLVSFNGKFTDDLKNNIKGGKKLLLSGNVENFIKDPVLKNIRLFIPQQLHLDICDTLAQIKGDVFINGNINKPDIIGQISLQNLFNKQIQLSLSNSSLDFNKNTILLNAPLVKLADTSMGINATISTDITKSLIIKNLNIKSKYLNTDTLLMYKDNLLTNSYPIEIQDGKFYSERILANIYGEPLYLSAFTADLNLVNDILYLKNITSELFNGKLAGTLAYNLKDEHFDTNIMTRNVSAEPIFDVISNRNDTVSGTMDFDANLKGELSSRQSLSGDIKFIVNNGRMSTLGKLEHLLYAQNVIADNMLRTSLSVVTKAITLKDTGLFKYLRGDITLADGIANINMLQSQGPLMALFIKGQYNPVNDYAKLVVLGRLSDEVLTGLGAFGDFSLNKLMVMLTGEDPKSNVLIEDCEKIPQLPIKNTKEFRTIINGIIDKPSSVLSFNWISYTKKSLRQNDVPIDDTKVPDFVNELPY